MLVRLGVNLVLEHSLVIREVAGSVPGNVKPNSFFNLVVPIEVINSGAFL